SKMNRAAQPAPPTTTRTSASWKSRSVFCSQTCRRPGGFHGDVAVPIDGLQETENATSLGLRLCAGTAADVSDRQHVRPGTDASGHREFNVGNQLACTGAVP